MAKMLTIKCLAVGELPLGRRGDVARIERNLFAENGDTFEALRFCKNRNGRHNRVHLVISEEAFVDLFADAIEKGVFSASTRARLRQILTPSRAVPPSDAAEEDADADDNPFLKVIGIGEDGHLTEGIDECLYGDPEE